MSEAASRERIGARMQESFRNLDLNGTSEVDVDAFVDFLRAPGTLLKPSLIVRLRFDDGSFEHQTVVAKGKINQRLSTQFLPFVDRVRHRIRGKADLLVLVSDTIAVAAEHHAQCIEFLKHVPLLRADWSDFDPVSMHSIIMPDPFIQDARYADEIESIREQDRRIPFPARQDRVLWRGRLTGPDYPDISNYGRFPRYALLKAASANPVLVDARLTHYDNIPATAAGDALREHLDGLLGGRVKPLPPADFVGHKYLISIDGVVSAWRRVPMTLYTGSVLLLQNRWNQFYYPGLTAWEHYVPLADDLSDLESRVQWLRSNPERAEGIGSAGRRFAETFLSVSAIEDHFVAVVDRCASLKQARYLPA